MTDRVAVVTGGFGALGRAVAEALLQDGFRVAAVDRTRALEGVGNPSYLAMGEVDLTSPDSTSRAFARVRDRWGQLDVLVNIAGGFRWQRLDAGTLDVWDEMYAVNLRTAVVSSSAALPHLLESTNAAIVNIGAGAALKTAAAGMGAYTASKAGVQKLTESLAQELKDKGVTVNAILPATIDTPANRRDMPHEDFTRWVAPRSIADLIVFLASGRARAITGAAIPVNGRG